VYSSLRVIVGWLVRNDAWFVLISYFERTPLLLVNGQSSDEYACFCETVFAREYRIYWKFLRIRCINERLFAYNTTESSENYILENNVCSRKISTSTFNFRVTFCAKYRSLGKSLVRLIRKNIQFIVNNSNQVVTIVYCIAGHQWHCQRCRGSYQRDNTSTSMSAVVFPQGGEIDLAVLAQHLIFFIFFYWR
jgi:hypothetical protein